jgi:hypothetical protein
MKETIRPENRLASIASPNGSIFGPRNSPSIALDVVRYWVLLRSWRWVIAFATASAVLTAFVVTKFILIKQYQAVAIIKAVSHKPGLAAAAGALLGGDTGLGGMLGQGLSGMGMGVSDQVQDHDPEELMAMMRSYAFTMTLVKKYDLAPHLLAEAPLGNLDRRSREWRLYKIMKSRFLCDFDFRTSLITAYFVDQDPIFAEQVLGDYVDVLRNQLRDQAVGSTATAIQSLQDEASRSPDALLRDQLYELVAEQIEDQKRAQMDANYAFRVIEPPITPPEKYFPSVRQFCLLALVLTPIVMIIGILTHAFLVKTLQMLRTLEQSGQHQWVNESSQHERNSEEVVAPDSFRAGADR